MKTLLVILFLVSGSPTVLSDMHPRQYVSEEICEARLEFIEHYLNKDATLPFVAACIDKNNVHVKSYMKSAKSLCLPVYKRWWIQNVKKLISQLHLEVIKMIKI